MGRVKTFTNGGNILPSDINSIEDDYEQAFSAYKIVFEDGIDLLGSNIYSGWPGSVPGLILVSTPHYVDQAMFTATPRTVKFRVAGDLLFSAIGTGGGAGTYQFGLYPISAVSGGSSIYKRPAGGGSAQGIIAVVPANGTVVAGSQPTAIVAPGATSISHAEGSDFNAPTAGWYALGVTCTGGFDSDTCSRITARLLYRAA